jgi:hypothetical protein
MAYAIWRRQAGEVCWIDLLDSNLAYFRLKAVKYFYNISRERFDSHFIVSHIAQLLPAESIW